MRWNGGRILSWPQLEGILSGKTVGSLTVVHDPADAAMSPQPAGDAMPFAELHAVSSYSFLRGASDPEALVTRAIELGISALAIVDRDGFYGAVQFAEAAAKCGLCTVFGAELSLPQGVLTVLARGLEGYQRLSRVIAAAQMKGGEKGKVCYPPLKVLAEQACESWQLLADETWLPHLDQLREYFGDSNVALEYRVTGTPADADAHAALDAAPKLRRVITGNPVAATRNEAALAAAKHVLRGGERHELHPVGGMWLRDGATLLRACPAAGPYLQTSVEIAAECAFSFALVAPELPQCDIPVSHTEDSWLAELVRTRGVSRYASRPADIRQRAERQIEHELQVIADLGFAGYFLIVCDIMDFCRRSNIFAQGRGSAANSAVCFALGITNVEPVQAELLFERFLAPDRDGPPDIDIDIESGRREEVIQYVYATYGRECAAQVANVISYRWKGALRDAARAYGYPQGTIDGWSRRVEEPPERVIKLAEQLMGQPRHLGVHSGGMVICDRPIADVVPTEWARMQDRSVVQWDKDDCAAAGLVKFDLLGLGMLEALHSMVDLIAENYGRRINLWELDLADSDVYAMLARGDAVGVFQVESRAQLATLPRIKPEKFFDLVVEIALIRPGPIQGGSVHPYIRRRQGLEPVVYDHPCLRPALEKTLGIPLFQEQLMQIARDAAGFSGAEADSLRRAMGAKRSPAKMAALKTRFFEGLRDTQGIAGEIAERLWNKMVAFAAYGFPESHSQSFAALAYFSAWLKYYYPAEFCVGLLRAQPMGFYSPQSLLADARRHGVVIDPICVQKSKVEATCARGRIRLGLNLVRGLGAAAEAIVSAAPFADIADLARRAHLSVAQVEALARAGALECFGLSRRQAQWAAGIAATEHVGMLPGLSQVTAPTLPGMSEFELMAADIASTGVTHQDQPIALLRQQLAARGIISAVDLRHVEDGRRIHIAGVVTHRQRPQTAGNITFFGMEDETGLINVMVSPGLWKRHHKLAATAKALVVRGIVQNASGAVMVVADHLERFELAEVFNRSSRDFR
ncbi:error-prone DNA polymerase [Corynebacterium sp.]|uniref:error-prone DNA polymerase n=1 Tax=Corynebacterium sp. TaxID=1720 RepID=UPI0026DD4565|nr:error-prone DNA polymerase [Corynebacterium sp.]MDO5077121.1 error-prone DNA polymerase [Corynebacterium sp.]